MKRLSLIAAILVATICSSVAASDAPEKDFAFAESLLKQGKEAFALLELERFRFYHPQHSRAAEAGYRAGRLYITYAGDMDEAARLLSETAQAHPGSPDAARIAVLQERIARNPHHDYRALREFCRAEDALEREAYDSAATSFQMIAQRYSDAPLAEDALFLRGKTLIVHLERSEDGLQDFHALTTRYPKSKYSSDMLYYLAVAVEQQKGGGEEAIAAYRRVTEKLPGTDYARLAQERITAIQNSGNYLTRQHRLEDVRSARVVKQGYSHDRPTVYSLSVECGADLSQEQVTATLEDVLLKHYRQRQRQQDTVEVIAYRVYPAGPLGSVLWEPGRAPQYAVREERKPEEKIEDVAKDVFLELLKGIGNRNKD